MIKFRKPKPFTIHPDKSITFVSEIWMKKERVGRYLKYILDIAPHKEPVEIIYELTSVGERYKRFTIDMSSIKDLDNKTVVQGKLII